jgi:hypothetical protein
MIETDYGLSPGKLRQLVERRNIPGKNSCLHRQSTKDGILSMTSKILTIFAVLLLAACNLPSQPTATPTADAVATQVSQLLTTMPTATTPPVNTKTPEVVAVPTDTPVPPTPTSTSTPPGPSPTSPPSVTSSEPDWSDDLSGGNAFYKFENENSRVTQQDGRLILTGLTANGWHGWSLTFSQQPRNFILEAVMIPQACSGADLYGLVFRAPNANSGYFFGVTCDGRYNLHRRDFEDGTDEVLLQLTSSASIQPGSNATNRLGVKAEDDRIGLYANGTLLQEVSDSSYQEGYFGPFVAAYETTGFTVWMDEIALWNLP